MNKKELRKLQEDFFKEQEKKRKKESEKINLKEEVFHPVQKLFSNILRTIIHSPFRKFFLILAGIIICIYFAFQVLIFFNDSKEAIQPDDNIPFQESVVEIKEYFMKENNKLKIQIENEKAIVDSYKEKYKLELKKNEVLQNKNEVLENQLEVMQKQLQNK